MGAVSATDRLGVPRDKVVEFCRRHHIRKMSLFGSILREDFRPDSDVDVLVEFEPGHSVGWDIVTMADELSELVGRKVDLNTPGSLCDHIRPKVKAEAEVLYGTE